MSGNKNNQAFPELSDPLETVDFLDNVINQKEELLLIRMPVLSFSLCVFILLKNDHFFLSLACYSRIS